MNVISLAGLDLPIKGSNWLTLAIFSTLQGLTFAELQRCKVGKELQSFEALCARQEIALPQGGSLLARINGTVEPIADSRHVTKLLTLKTLYPCGFGWIVLTVRYGCRYKIFRVVRHLLRYKPIRIIFQSNAFPKTNLLNKISRNGLYMPATLSAARSAFGGLYLI